MTLSWIHEPISPWQKAAGDYSDIVLDSRIRLVRNLKNYVFPNRASGAELAAICDEGKRQIPILTMLGKGAYTYIDIGELSQAEREVLVAKHLVSAALIAAPKGRGVMVRDDGAVSIMLNEADHFCIQTALPGLDVQTSWDMAEQVDDALESKLQVAFRDEVGYLSASPFFTGTGLVAGVTVHVPALVAMKRLNRIIQSVTKFGFTVTGVYGDRSEPLGNIFQITNQLTLGVTEGDMLSQLDRIVKQVVEEEKSCRDLWWQQHHDELRDKWLRAYGILKYAYLLGEAETLILASDVRLAVDMGIIKGNPLVYESLATAATPAMLQWNSEKELTDHELELRRAEIAKQIVAAYIEEE